MVRVWSITLDSDGFSALYSSKSSRIVLLAITITILAGLMSNLLVGSISMHYLAVPVCTTLASSCKNDGAFSILANVIFKS
jgi:hypothetical protein